MYEPILFALKTKITILNSDDIKVEAKLVKKKANRL